MWCHWKNCSVEKKMFDWKLCFLLPLNKKFSSSHILVTSYVLVVLWEVKHPCWISCWCLLCCTGKLSFFFFFNELHQISLFLRLLQQINFIFKLHINQLVSFHQIYVVYLLLWLSYLQMLFTKCRTQCFWNKSHPRHQSLLLHMLYKKTKQSKKTLLLNSGKLEHCVKFKWKCSWSCLICKAYPIKTRIFYLCLLLLYYL